MNLMSRFPRPETAVLTLANGDQLTVKRRLTAGEQMDAYARMYTEQDGRRFVDPLVSGLAMIEAYLLDWSLTDDEGHPVVILRQPRDVLVGALRNLDYPSYIEVKEAIEAHEARINRERVEKKTDPAGALASSETSTSPDAAAGGSNGSGILTPMTTR
jgi:hypothetical protein